MGQFLVSARAFGAQAFQFGFGAVCAVPCFLGLLLESFGLQAELFRLFAELLSVPLRFCSFLFRLFG